MYKLLLAGVVLGIIPGRDWQRKRIGNEKRTTIYQQT
jgi:hypothetical protein